MVANIVLIAFNSEAGLTSPDVNYIGQSVGQFTCSPSVIYTTYGHAAVQDLAKGGRKLTGRLNIACYVHFTVYHARVF